MLASGTAIRSLSKSSGGVWSFRDDCDDGCDERNEARELDVARRANGDSGALEGDRPLDGGREGTSVLRPLSNR